MFTRRSTSRRGTRGRRRSRRTSLTRVFVWLTTRLERRNGAGSAVAGSALQHLLEREPCLRRDALGREVALHDRERIRGPFDVEVPEQIAHVLLVAKFRAEA